MSCVFYQASWLFEDKLFITMHSVHLLNTGLYANTVPGNEDIKVNMTDKFLFLWGLTSDGEAGK